MTIRSTCPLPSCAALLSLTPCPSLSVMLMCRVFPSQTFATNMQIKTGLFIAMLALLCAPSQTAYIITQTKYANSDCTGGVTLTKTINSGACVPGNPGSDSVEGDSCANAAFQLFNSSDCTGPPATRPIRPPLNECFFGVNQTCQDA